MIGQTRTLTITSHLYAASPKRQASIPAGDYTTGMDVKDWTLGAVRKWKGVQVGDNQGCSCLTEPEIHGDLKETCETTAARKRA